VALPLTTLHALLVVHAEHALSLGLGLLQGLAVQLTSLGR